MAAGITKPNLWLGEIPKQSTATYNKQAANRFCG
jgi:hypothetical protein